MVDRYPNVNCIAPERVFIEDGAIIENGVIIYPDNYICKDCKIRKGAVLLPENILENAEIGENSKIEKSVIRSAKIGSNCSVGPYAHLRKGVSVGDNCRIGDFVELKNSSVGSGTKISHLAYVGDARIGKNCNIGCGVVFCNYDGKNKHKTVVGNDCFIGSNVNLVAPLILSDGVFVAAGTTITENAEKGDFVIGRARQQIKSGIARRYFGGKDE